MANKVFISKLLVGLTIISVVCALSTLIPFDGASKQNILGYKSLCTFTPVSTIICLLLANTFYGIRKKKFLS